ncbi:Tripartite motif-containing protein 16 [Acipenser ruthenus]|uniref:Tripartite motif-containing protein 16 n=1 Tax=Acipenser ruthenus TaxID=7906 RepID=A0A444US12_ACIRT|nr:Tripartite motif-containing protein 16 [Acipenser ruthenus]
MASNVLSEDQFICSVCLDLLKDPVTVPCGHSYCMGCIKNCWDQADHTGVYSCPQCRETFTPRPVLCRNTMLTEVVERLKEIALIPVPAQSYAGTGDVSCDFCNGRKLKAVKSCLTCLASYCEKHIKPHSEVATLKTHKLVSAIGNLEQKLCAEHHKVLEVFCRTDQKCICLLCTDKEHKSHDTISAETERTGKEKCHFSTVFLLQEQLGKTQKELELRIQERLKELKQLKLAVESLNKSAKKEIKESKKIFTELIQSIEKIRSEVIELIGASKTAAVNQAEGLMKKLEQEIAELRRRNTELKQLSETEDNIHFLQNFQSLCAHPEAGDLPSVPVNPDISFGAVRKAVSEIKAHIEDFCKGGLIKITKTDSCRLTLDPNTAHCQILLSEGNTKMTRGKPQPYPDHPDRFVRQAQVLCREGLSGTRYYWEIEWCGGRTYFGVAYKGIGRKDGSSVIGFNDKSWGLDGCYLTFSACHKKRINQIDHDTFFPRIGVYLDDPAGTLSFYGVSDDTMTLLHRFETTFTEMLYPAFYVYDSDLKICQLN